MTGSYYKGDDFVGHLTTITNARLADQGFGVSELAREMGFSRTTLHRLMKEVFNCSASLYVNKKSLKKPIKC